MFGKVLAVWDKGVKTTNKRALAPRGPAPTRWVKPGEGGFLATLKALRKRIVLKEHYIEAGLFLVFALAMAGFAIDWALRIMGLK
jgi:hypothetical protein